jgi:hypothetical protein
MSVHPLARYRDQGQGAGRNQTLTISKEKFTMHRKSIFASLVLAVSLTMVACVGRVRVYDQWHGDYHRWDDHEEVVYRGYLSDNHREYRAYTSLSVDDQRAYFDWRHTHP